MEDNMHAHTGSRRFLGMCKQLLSSLVAGGVAVVLALLLSGAFVPSGSLINFVDGDSMEPALTHGQILFADLSELQRGDIVITRMPASTGTDDLIVKRVIALPGDTLTINAEGIFINNQRFDEPYLTEEAAAATYMKSRYNYLILGADEYFLLGDNRANSLDSRYFGPVQTSDLEYKQSVSPTQNTYMKLFILVVLVVLCSGLYFFLDASLTKLLNRQPLAGKTEVREERS